MDRVICGDVGFGKTEVALRAAATFALSGKQVAIAVPTTVLARQHVATFRKRFGPLGIEVGNLSRATSAADARETKEGLRRGKLKVVVGTQALVSKDVKFGDLGLVIIDEEQHFGAAEKVKLSSLTKGVHTLWMSATPIPRTLAAGLAGFRDLSVIATPPVHRLPIVTKVAPLSDAAIASALLREQRRRGQSFLICPRIQDLEPMLARVQAAAPDLRIVCLHGRLPADEIDDRMMSFVEAGQTFSSRPISWRAASTFPVRTPWSSAGRKSSVWLSSISSEAGSDGAARAPLRICCPSRAQNTPKSVLPFWKSSVNLARVSPSASAISTSEERETFSRSDSPAMCRFSDRYFTATF